MLHTPFFRIAKKNDFQFDVSLEASHPLFEAHFPSFPILPGSCVTEIILQAMQVQTGNVYDATHFSKMKFVRPIVPGNPIYNLTLKAKENGDGSLTVDATLATGAEVNCKASLKLKRYGEDGNI